MYQHRDTERSNEEKDRIIQEKEELLKLIEKARDALQVVPKDNPLYSWWQGRLARTTKVYTGAYGEVPRVEKDIKQGGLF